MGAFDNNGAFIKHDYVNGAPAIFIEDESTSIQLMNNTTEYHFITKANSAFIGQPMYIAQTLYSECEQCGLDSLTVNGKRENMIYDTAGNNLTRYIQSEEYRQDDIYKQMLVGVMVGLITKCVELITSYKQFPVQKDIRGYLRNIILHRDDFIIYAGKCIRFLEIQYTGHYVNNHGYIPGYYGYYDTYIDKYTKIN